MKSEKLIFLILAIGVLAMGFIAYFGFKAIERENREIKKLKENIDIVSRYDSIADVRDKVLFDSIQSVRNSVSENKQLQHDENRKLRQQNTLLEKRYRDIVLPVRPDF